MHEVLPKSISTRAGKKAGGARFVTVTIKQAMGLAEGSIVVEYPLPLFPKMPVPAIPTSSLAPIASSKRPLNIFSASASDSLEFIDTSAASVSLVLLFSLEQEKTRIQKVKRRVINRVGENLVCINVDLVEKQLTALRWGFRTRV